jgi:hypothetical protein
MPDEMSYLDYRRTGGKREPKTPARKRVTTRPRQIITLEEYLDFGNFGAVEREKVWHPTRKWRADYFLPDQKPPVIVEYYGLMHHGANQGHATITNIMRDQEKANEAQAMGYRIYRANAKTVDSGDFFALLARVLERKD